MSHVDKTIKMRAFSEDTPKEKETAKSSVEIKRLSEELAKKDAQLEEAKNKSLQYLNTIDQLRDGLRQEQIKSAELSKRANDLEEKQNKLIESSKKLMDRQEAKIAEQQATITGQQARTTSLEAELAEQKNRLVEQENKMLDKEAETTALQSDKIEQEKKLAAQTDRIRVLVETLGKISSTVMAAAQADNT